MTETTTIRVPLVEDSPPLVVKRWPRHPRSVHKARHLLRRHVDAWGMSRLADSAELVLSELATNAVRHAHIPGRLIETRYERLTNGVRIEVHDAGDTKPERREPSADDDSGRGLTLVDALTDGQWGVSARTGVGKLVWAVCTDAGEPHPGHETVEGQKRMTPFSPEVTRADPDTR
ncbi:ATP-binding protein [Streptomyces sp. NBC_00370]|uniref:ATP-binding protein n=1 Tax=Streptomyces sp. NBC_00370 TaxID=2975728 RepID=UPI002E271EFB